MSFQVGREMLKNYLNNYVAFVAMLKNANMSQELMNVFNNSVNEIKDLSPSVAPPYVDCIEPDCYINSLPAVKAFFYCLYCLIFLVGICGNALVCYVVLRNKNMQTVTNLFITNLALSDILLCTFAVPFTPLYLLTFRSWVFGKVFCHLLPYAQGVSVYISAFTLMSIAIDRFFVIIYPFKPRMEIRICLTIIACVWITAAVLTFPYGWYMELMPENGQMFCEEMWPREESRKAFGFSTSVLQFVIPFIIISFCYMKVCFKLRDRARAKPGAKSVRKEELERERTRRTNRMLISMVVIFGISWLPLNINNLVQDFYLPATQWRYARAFFLLAHAAAMSSTCYNPFMYAWLNENFRKEFEQVLPCFNSGPLPSPVRPRHQQQQAQDFDEPQGERTCNGHETIQMQEQSLVAHRNNSLNDEAEEVVIPLTDREQQEKKETTSASNNKSTQGGSKSTTVCYVTTNESVKLQLATNAKEDETTA